MKIKLLAALSLIVATMATHTVSAQVNDVYDPFGATSNATLPGGSPFNGGAQAAIVAGSAILYSNGPISNSTGTGAGGADESILYNVTLGMGIYGFGHQSPNSFRIADDFVLNVATNLRQVIFYAYQTGSSTTSTITGATLQIWKGKPGEPGSTVVWGDTTTNILDTTAWTGVYRILENTPGDTLRPIMSNLVNVGHVLLPGTYWLDWDATGTLGSGPWAPPIAGDGITAGTGDAIQFTGSWAPVIDVEPQGFPFEIVGNVIGPIPTLSKFGQLALILLVFGVFVARQRRQETT